MPEITAIYQISLYISYAYGYKPTSQRSSNWVGKPVTANGAGARDGGLCGSDGFESSGDYTWITRLALPSANAGARLFCSRLPVTKGSSPA